MDKSALAEETASDSGVVDYDGKYAKQLMDQTHGYRLGSDDPFWPHYLKEAEKYDDLKVDKWEKKMDTLLLFATLFSAIVTAFVIESSHNLQPDSAAITAAAVVDIVGILRNGSSAEDQQDPILRSLVDFQPTKNAFVVNFVWFISLCLSITVALLAGLVKQWSNSLRWDRTAPPCNQARIRQARLNNLIRGRTELVISAIRVIMDAALGMFLLGLLVFLHDLSHDIYLAALVVTGLTMAFYFATTFAPYFVSFCPYETPVSSRKACGWLYQVYLALSNAFYRHILGDKSIEAEADFKNPMCPCEKKERKMAGTTDPDRLTGDALNWIILHSQKREPREMAIRAIATLDSPEALEQLGSPGILPQVIQSFTSCFIVRDTKDGQTELKLKDSTDIDTVSLHGRALTVLVAQGVHAGNDIEVGFAESSLVVDKTTKEAVKERFEYLGDLTSRETLHDGNLTEVSNPEIRNGGSESETKPSTATVRGSNLPHNNDDREGNLLHVTSETQRLDAALSLSSTKPTSGEGQAKSHGAKGNPEKETTALKLEDQTSETRVWALVGLSAWHDFIGHDKGLRFNHGKAICDLAKSLEWSLSSGLRKEVLHTLTKELSYWAPTISTKNRKETLRHLVKLVPKTPPELLPHFACALAVLALQINHGTSYLVSPSSDSRTSEFEEENYDGAALQVMDHYANKPEQLVEDGQSLLLFALAGLMEYYEHCDFDQEAHHNMIRIAQRFQEFDGLGKLQSLDIPVTLPTSRGNSKGPLNPCDYYVSTLLLYLKRPRRQQHSRQMDEIFTYLLRSINRERQSRELIRYGSQIIPIIAQILGQTKDTELKAECLRALVSYWGSGPSFLYVQIVLFYEVPAKLVQLVEHRTQKLEQVDEIIAKNPKDQTNGLPQPSDSSKSILLSAASEVFNKIGDQVKQLTKFDEERLVSCMNDIMHNGLLWVLLAILNLDIPSSQKDGDSGPTLRDVRAYLGEDSTATSGVNQLLKIMVEGYEREQAKNTIGVIWGPGGAS
ncbi:unnamed protein product [Rhizoctonia solani]|uniref:DUF6535 domain-containing protein n=1 Tax=Rhizoctonia solani TaxID=456999 RepID=A0A8H3DXJ9_9AGAM|nr:unnamed protein product [Rhizoctonia solani]